VVAVVAIGTTLLAAAVLMKQRWLDRHFLPSFFVPREWIVAIETAVRLGFAAIGTSLLFLSRRIGRFAARAPTMVLSVGVAIALAIGAGELALRQIHVQPAAWLFFDEEPRRQPDATLGWTLVPGRTGRNTIGGRPIDYVMDVSGYRVRRADEAVDRERPTILFTGESVMFGEGLTWDESIPAQVGKMTGIQSANLAVHGYGNDQAYLRLAAELPRFRRPVAVVSLFMTALFGRNLEDDRPHLAPGLVWTAPERRGRLASLAIIVMPYRTDRDVEDGVAMTREVLRATIRMASARGAATVIVVPQIGPEDAAEHALRARVLDEAAIPYVRVELDAASRLPWDRHPNARAAQLVASAIAARLQGSGTPLATQGAGTSP